MTSRILVAYASKYGATAEIATKIGEVLGEAGLKVNVLPVEQVYDLTPFAAVILGSAVYLDSWMSEAIKFLEEYHTLLEKLPVWLFSSGPMGTENSSALVTGSHFTEAQRHLIDRIHPRNIAIFPGAVDMEKLNFAEKLIIKEAKAPVGDFRDWSAIVDWASHIAAELLPKP
jgi:menaquinone-dependent protoporphyrinogen oxidase